MTENTKTNEELSAEVERLRQKNTELLGELKQSRSRVKELEEHFESEGKELEAIKAELLNLKLNHPVADLLEGVLAGGKYAAMELAEHYKFELNAEGKIELRDLEGNPATLTERVDGKEVTRPVRFEEQDVWRYLGGTGKFDHILRSSGATGGGAPNNNQVGGAKSTAKPESRKATGAGFGLK